MDLLQKIEHIEIQQIIGLSSGTIEQARELHRQKMELVTLHRLEQMAIQDDKLANRRSFIRRLFRL